MEGPQGTQKMQGVSPELCVPGLDAVPGQDALGREWAWPWPYVRSYTMQCRQGAGSNISMSVTRALLQLQDNTHGSRDSPALCWASLTRTRGGSEGSLTLPRRHFGGAKIGSLVPGKQCGSSLLLAAGERSAPGIRGRQLKALLTWPGAAPLSRQRCHVLKPPLPREDQPVPPGWLSMPGDMSRPPALPRHPADTRGRRR